MQIKSVLLDLCCFFFVHLEQFIFRFLINFRSIIFFFLNYIFIIRILFLRFLNFLIFFTQKPLFSG